MSRPRNRSSSFFEDTDIFSDGEFDVEEFMDDMSDEDALREYPVRRKRAAWQRLEDWREWQWMREQLNDWDDWELD